MIFSTPETTNYYYSLVREQRRYEFLAVMFAPEAMRDALIALYALDIELAHIHHLVKEEMMGHIRYAWWQEAVEDLENRAGQQPVLAALLQAGFNKEKLLQVVEVYKDKFPEQPENTSELLRKIVMSSLRGGEADEAIQIHSKKDWIASPLTARNDAAKWQKATNIITAHRAKHGTKKYNWLLVKLLWV